MSLIDRCPMQGLACDNQFVIYFECSQCGSLCVGQTLTSYVKEGARPYCIVCSSRVVPASDPYADDPRSVYRIAKSRQ